MNLIENLQSQAKRARDNYEIVDKALCGIIRAIFDSSPSVTYEKATEVASDIIRALYDKLFKAQIELDSAEDMKLDQEIRKAREGSK